MTDTAPTTPATSTPACCAGTVDAVASDEAAELATLLGALADPVRLQILSIIGRSPSGEVCACDFVGPIDRSQPTISHHLKVLAEAGVVTGDKRGRWVWYRAVPERLAGVQHALDTLTG